MKSDFWYQHLLPLAPKPRWSKNWSRGIKHPAWHSRNTPQRARKAGKYLAWPLTNCSNSSNTFFFKRYEDSTPFTIIRAIYTLPCYYHTSLDLVCIPSHCIDMLSKLSGRRVLEDGDETSTCANNHLRSKVRFHLRLQWPLIWNIQKYVCLQNLMASSRWCPWRTFTGVV